MENPADADEEPQMTCIIQVSSAYCIMHAGCTFNSFDLFLHTTYTKEYIALFQSLQRAVDISPVMGRRSQDVNNLNGL